MAREGEASPSGSSGSGRREFVPGDRVVFMAKARDLQSGIRRDNVDGKDIPVIYLQIRDPDGKYQDAAGKEHKTTSGRAPRRRPPAPRRCRSSRSPSSERRAAAGRGPADASGAEFGSPGRERSAGDAVRHPWFPNVDSMTMDLPVCDPNNPNPTRR